MKKSDYIKKIIRFNADKNVIRLKEKYNEASFFEIIAKERSETTYSAFLKWLLEGKAVGTEELSPLMMLLDILVKRTEDYPCPETSVSPDLKNGILTRSLALNNITATVEKSVGSLTCEIAGGNAVCSSDQLNGIAAKCTDRIDLLLQCDVSAEGLKSKPMQVIIENKIDSKEGGKKNNGKIGVGIYDNASQTERYYMATQRGDVYQWYVYLTPEPQILNRHYSMEEEPTDPHFIHITYQDILDGIIIPLLASSSISSRARFFLEEFRDQLAFPSLDGASVQPSIAIGNDQSKELTAIWNDYEELITDSALAASEGTFWRIGDVWYDHQPRVELAIKLKDLGAPEAENFLTKDATGRDITSKGLHYKKIVKVAEKNGIETEISENDFGENQVLLEAFWDKNKRFLTALLGGIEGKENVLALAKEVAKRDTTKYTVFFDGNVLAKSAPKGVTAWTIVTKWAQLYRAAGKKLDLECLRKTFPRTCNPYYEQGKWYKHLFYQKGACVYDGEKGDGSVPTSHWDIDFNGKYDIPTDDGAVVFLKMWRKDALEQFIEKTEAMSIFRGKLSVISE